MLIILGGDSSFPGPGHFWIYSCPHSLHTVLLLANKVWVCSGSHVASTPQASYLLLRGVGLGEWERMGDGPSISLISSGLEQTTALPFVGEK